MSTAARSRRTHGNSRWNRYGIRAMLVLVCGTLACGPLSGRAAAQSSVALTLRGVPLYAPPGQTLLLELDYQKPASVAEKRLVFVVELRRASDDSLLVSAVNDNQSQGFAAPSGTVAVSLAIPSGAAGAAYLRACAAPWSLNRAVIEQFITYPTDGTHKYAWVSGYGVTQDLYYLGTLIARTNAERSTYCCGLTFEVFLVACNHYNTRQGHARIGSMDAAAMEKFRRLWYGSTDADKLAVRAITDYSLGIEITDREQAQEGDFVQFWRHSGSGHSVVFIRWVRNTAGAITGVRYWSTQTSTDGIGYQTESFGETTGMNPARFWIGRLRKPRDAADWEWALGTTDTRPATTQLSPQPSGWMLHE